MIYKRIRKVLLRLLKAPDHPPDPPAGSPESVRIFRAAPNFLKLRMLVWGAGFAAGLAQVQEDAVRILDQLGRTKEAAEWRAQTEVARSRGAGR